MGVDTILKITSNPKREDILEVLKENSKVSNCLLENSTIDKTINFLYFSYKNSDGVKEKRKLNIFEKRKDDLDCETYKVLKNKSYTSLYLSSDETSIEIMSYIVNKLGGVFIKNDVDYNFKIYPHKKIKTEKIDLNYKKLKEIENELTFSL